MSEQQEPVFSKLVAYDLDKDEALASADNLKSMAIGNWFGQQRFKLQCANYVLIFPYCDDTVTIDFETIVAVIKDREGRFDKWQSI